ncbi:unnamed protein product [Candida verbasci]|uniref:Trafficking protein particle complex subunit n=1 Tax=Candida verbasci TaxID=1227364 RepID=A0A9W4TV54_9ASCO|nr:unnamed protein product [Candida verbasci]
MSDDSIIIPSTTTNSLSKLTINDYSKTGFGYNPSIGTQSNSINNIETSNLLISKKQIILSTSTIPIYEKLHLISKKSPIEEITLSSLLYLFSEIIQWQFKNSKNINDLEARLNGLGYKLGIKLIEMIKLKDGYKLLKRDTKILEILQFIHGPFWKFIFGKQADELEMSQNNNDEYMIIDNLPILNKYISIPKDYGDLNCCAFVAGIIEGSLDVSGFNCNVTAHTSTTDQHPLRTVYLIKFHSNVLYRENIRN